MGHSTAVRNLARSVRHAGRWVRHQFRLYQPPERIAADAQAYWTSKPGEETPAENYHWRGSPLFEDDSKWLALGRRHLELFEGFARMANLPLPVGRVIEWGCGGGANAVHFAKHADSFVGVDLSQPTLDECGKQMTAEELSNFTPVCVKVGEIAPVVERFRASCDLFLSTFVFELLPSQQHGIELLQAARELLKPGGMALIQIKYDTGSVRTRSRRWGYTRDLANMTTFRIDEFWTIAQEAGFEPVGVHLVPKQPDVRDERYAYFALRKPVHG